MDKQDEALKLLKEIKSINFMIENIQAQIDETYSMLTSTTVKPKEVDVQTSKQSDPMADKLIKIMEFQTKLQDYQMELIEKKAIALKVIKQMDIEMQQLLLLRYFQGYSIEQIAEQIAYTARWTWEKIHLAEEMFISIYAMN